MNYEKIVKQIEDFIRKKSEGFNGVVIGLSGGVDSTVVAYLSVRAIGNDSVYALIMPYNVDEHTKDGIEVANILGIKYKLIDIKPLVKNFENTGYFGNSLSKGNLMARIRMCLLYGVANERNMLVLGTSNKSEISIGYFTKYGDGGVDVEPIGDLYKTEVWKFAKYLGIPEKIINKIPSAGLWEGQTDEGEIGMDYFTLDKILRGETDGIDESKIRKVESLIKKTQHKREFPKTVVIER